MVYILSDIFNIIKEYLISDYGSIMNLSKKIYGLADKYLLDYNNNRNKKCNDMYLEETSSYTFYNKIELTNKHSSLVSFILPHERNLYDRIIYKNVQFKGNIDNIEWIELQVGGQLIDRINMVFYKTLQKFYKMDGIPFYSFKYGHFMAFYHQTKILFKVRKPTKITLQLDKYHKQFINLKMEQLLYLNSLELNVKCAREKDNNIYLYFNLPTYFLLCNHKLENIQLILSSDKEHDEHYYEFDIHQYGQIIRLTPKLDSDDISNYSFNFSRVQNIRLKFDSPNSDKIIISSIHFNVLRHESGLTGLAFAS